MNSYLRRNEETHFKLLELVTQLIQEKVTGMRTGVNIS
jgi:hypothetical protein